MPIYKNEKLKLFKEKGIIETINYEQFKKLWSQIKRKKIRMAFTIMYFSGCRPVELRHITCQDVTIEGKYYKIGIPAAKNGRFRYVYIPRKYSEMEEVFEFTQNYPPQYRLFSEYVWLKDIRHHLTYYFKKYNIGVPPYFLRHNRMSLLSMKGASVEQIKYFKGAKTIASVEPYIHLSSKKAKKIGKLI